MRPALAADEDFAKANQFYSAKAYDSALVLYKSIEGTGVESAELNFNIGNCYFKSGDIGRAVVYYLRAKRLSPGDDDIKANLAFARGFTRIQMEGVQLNPVYSLVEGIVDPVELNLLAWVSSGCFIFFFVLLTLRFGFGWSGIGRGAIVSVLAILALSAFATTFKYRHDYLVERAVVVSEDCPVLSGPTPQAQTELHGAPGLVVEIVGSSGGYYNVLFENKRRGWIAKDHLELV
jgi:tetratricopeptide (TPR) repeat protein